MIITNVDNNDLESIFSLQECVFKEEPLLTGLDYFNQVTSLDDLTKIVERYRSIDAWSKTTEFSEEEFDHLQDIMINAKELDSKVPFSDLMYEN